MKHPQEMKGEKGDLFIPFGDLDSPSLTPPHGLDFLVPQANKYIPSGLGLFELGFQLLRTESLNHFHAKQNSPLLWSLCYHKANWIPHF